MSSKKPIDKQYLLDSLKNFDKEVLEKKYSSNISDETGNPTGFPEISSLESATTLNEQDVFLVETEEGNRKIIPQTLADGLKPLLDIQPVTPDEVVKIPFIRGFRLYMKDIETTIPANKNTIILGSMESIFGIADMSNIYGLLGYAIGDGYVGYVSQTGNGNIIFGRSTNTSSSKNITVRVCLIVRDAEVTDGTGGEILPLFPGYKIAQKTIIKNIAKGTKLVEVCDISEFGIIEEDVLLANVSALLTTINNNIWNGFGYVNGSKIYFSTTSPEGISNTYEIGFTVNIFYKDESAIPSNAYFPDIYTTEDIPYAESVTENDKFLFGTSGGNRIATNQMLTDYLKTRDLINLDGKGRPLLPGYGIVTKDVIVNFSSGEAYTTETYTELFAIEDEKDIVYIGVFEPTQKPGIFIDALGTASDGSKRIRMRNANGYSLNNVQIRLMCIYKKPVPYEPGLKTVKYTKTLSLKPVNTNTPTISWTEFDLSDFDEGLKEDIITSIQMLAHSENTAIRNAIPILPGGNKIRVLGLIAGASYTNQTFDFIFTVKDYSSIGPSIVTNGIQMITKEITKTVSGSGSTNTIRHVICPVSEFDVQEEDIVGVLGSSKIGDDDWLTGYAMVQNGSIAWAGMSISSSASYNVTFKITLFVKVPVIEPRKPFVKDVEVTFNGIASVGTGVILDGSDEVGGYTLDNLKSYNVSSLTPGKWINSVCISNDHQIYIDSESHVTGTGKLRIYIE